MTRIVITMTTSPGRLTHLPEVLEALLSQTTSPDALYINLPERYRNRETYVIPSWLARSTEVTVVNQPDDLGPVMKILPALEIETAPKTLLITVDDDVRYPADMISVFQKAADSHPEAAFGARGFNFTNQGQHLHPVRGHLVHCDVLQGYGACAYRRAHFDLDRFRLSLDAYPEAFRFSDDVLLSNHIASMGVPRFTVELASPLEHMPWGDEDPQSLKFVDGGTHRRYEAVRKWHIQEDKWFAQGQTRRL